jgi:pantoate--beta-alanine ligase
VQIIKTIEELRLTLRDRNAVALVPTMGNLHEGHLSLVRIARQRAKCVVTSIFVNRLQFAPQEDFATYPRTFERDSELLERSGCDILFAPTEAEIYPSPQGYKVHPPAQLAEVLEGAVRPGFFVGVCTVVSKFFHIVQPDFAVFGKKDYQQLLVLQNMVRQLALPIDMIAAETVRDHGGLALSSRNGYLNDTQRSQATELHQVLETLVTAVKSGRKDWKVLEGEAIAFLEARGWRPDYVAVRRRADLQEPKSTEQPNNDPLVVLAAARLGDTRLIDNVEI